MKPHCTEVTEQSAFCIFSLLLTHGLEKTLDFLCTLTVFSVD
jgi:hypothetical protein